MNYLFLDIDGVMVGFSDRKKYNRGIKWNDFWIPERTLALLKELYTEFRPRIVITSTWRKNFDAMRYLYKTFEDNGIKIWGKLANRGEKEELIKDYIKKLEEFYLQDNKLKYIVLDDCNFNITNFIKVDSYEGLTEKDIDKIKKIYNKE